MNKVVQNLIFIILITNIGFSQNVEKHVEYFELPHKKEYSIKRVYYLNENSELTGEDTYFFMGTNKKKEINHWENGMLTDSVVRFDDSGKVTSVGYIVENKLIFKDHQTGRVLSIVSLRNGQKNGLEVIYDRTDKIRHFKLYIDNILTMLLGLEENKKFKGLITYEIEDKFSSSTQSYPNGVLKSMVFNYNNSLHIMVHILFYENGQIKSIEYRAMNEAIGIYSPKDEIDKYSFDENGELIQKK